MPRLLPPPLETLDSFPNRLVSTMFGPTLFVLGVLLAGTVTLCPRSVRAGPFDVPAADELTDGVPDDDLDLEVETSGRPPEPDPPPVKTAGDETISPDTSPDTEQAITEGNIKEPYDPVGTERAPVEPSARDLHKPTGEEATSDAHRAETRTPSPETAREAEKRAEPRGARRKSCEADRKMLRDEEELSIQLLKDSGGSDTIRSLKRGLMGQYGRQAHRKRVMTVLDEYREVRESSQSLPSCDEWRRAIGTATQGSYRLFKTGSALDDGEEPDLFDYWRFVFRGASFVRDKKAAVSAYEALQDAFGRDPKFNEFLDHKRKIMADLY